MPPVNDDVILFVVLAAGLRPVQAPLSGTDGSIGVDAVPASLWDGLCAVALRGEQPRHPVTDR